MAQRTDTVNGSTVTASILAQQPPSVNENDAYYVEQLADGEFELDVFAALGLHAGGALIHHRALRSHFRKVVMPHLFKRNGPVIT